MIRSNAGEVEIDLDQVITVLNAAYHESYDRAFRDMLTATFSIQKLIESSLSIVELGDRIAEEISNFNQQEALLLFDRTLGLLLVARDSDANAEVISVIEKLRNLLLAKLSDEDANRLHAMDRQLQGHFAHKLFE